MEVLKTVTVQRKEETAAPTMQIRGRAMRKRGVLKFETLNVEMFFSTLIASALESAVSGTLSFSPNAALLFGLSFVGNIFLIELAFRLIRVTKNGRIKES